MGEPELPDRIGVHVARRQIVEDEDPARRQQSDELFVVLRPAAVGEEQVERRLLSKDVLPVAVEHRGGRV